MTYWPESMAPESKPFRVLATRPAAQNAGWCELLQRAGLHSLPVPVLGIEPVQEPSRCQTLKNLILNFDQFSKVIFVSQNAVNETLRWLDDYWPQLPCDIAYFAVGRKTARALEEYGIAANSCSHAMDSDELLALPQLQVVAGEKILLCRGVGGRPRLADVLQERGAQVVYGEFYTRVLPDQAAEMLRQSDFGQGAYTEVLSAFSGESLENLMAVLDAADIAHWREMPVLVPGERVAQQARDAGFTRVIAAFNATDEAMLQALQHNLN